MALEEDDRSAARSDPVFNAPPIVMWLIGALLVIHGAFFLMSGRADALIDNFGAVSPRVFAAGLAGRVGPMRAFAPLVTHIFIHASWPHVLVNSVALLIFGTPIAYRLGAGRGAPLGPSLKFLTFFVLSGVAGALTFILLHPHAGTLLVGASGGISGLLGGVIRLGIVRSPKTTLLQGGFTPLADRAVIAASAALLLANFATGIMGGVFAPHEGSVAWEAHMGGYLFGLVTFPAFATAARPR